MSKKPFADYLREDQRLVILRVLSDMPSYRANSSVLYNLLDTFGHSPSRDQVKSHLRWLEEQDLVEIEDVSDLLIATLTSRGQDVAQGRVMVDGVKRPGAR